MAVEIVKAPKPIARAQSFARSCGIAAFGAPCRKVMAVCPATRRTSNGHARRHVASADTNDRTRFAPWRIPLAQALQEQGSTP